MLHLVACGSQHGNPGKDRIDRLGEVRHPVEVVQQGLVGSRFACIKADRLGGGKNADGLLAEIHGPYPPEKLRLALVWRQINLQAVGKHLPGGREMVFGRQPGSVFLIRGA